MIVYSGGMEIYEIRVQSHLGPNCAAIFEGFSIQHLENGQTVLTGPIVDQPALHGVLMKIRDLGLVLVEVKHIGTDTK